MTDRSSVLSAPGVPFRGCFFGVGHGAMPPKITGGGGEPRGGRLGRGIPKKNGQLGRPTGRPDYGAGYLLCTATLRSFGRESTLVAPPAVGRRHERAQFFAFALRHFGRLPVLLSQPASALTLLGGSSQSAFLKKYQNASTTPSSPTGPMTGMARIAPANANRNNLQTSFISGLCPNGVQFPSARQPEFGR